MNVQTIVVDPGLSTGVAVFRNRLLVRTFTDKLPFEELSRLLDVRPDDYATNVVCESAPEVHRHYSDAFAIVKAMVEASGLPVVWATPSQWKGHPRSVLIDSDVAWTPHERDAIRLGRWYFARNKTQ